MTLEASRSASRSAVAATGTTPPELAVAGRDVRGRASSSAVPVRRSRAARMGEEVKLNSREGLPCRFGFRSGCLTFQTSSTAEGLCVIGGVLGNASL